MLNKLKPSRKEEKPRLSRPQTRLMRSGKKYIEKLDSENHPSSVRISELEEEIERLRLTVKFYQDMYFQDD